MRFAQYTQKIKKRVIYTTLFLIFLGGSISPGSENLTGPHNGVFRHLSGEINGVHPGQRWLKSNLIVSAPFYTMIAHKSGLIAFERFVNHNRISTGIHHIPAGAVGHDC
jgi:hypothetical protein